MDTSVKAQWLERLRSDEWEPGRIWLRSLHNEHSSLGLLCDIVAPEGWAIAPVGGGYAHLGHWIGPSLSLMESTGIPWELVQKLMNMNAYGVPFEKQAEYIDLSLD